MSGRARAGALLACALVAGCSAQRQAKPARPVHAPELPAAVSGNRELVGVWVEYWARSGKADTQRFAFLSDGRFVWDAAVSGQLPAAGPARKSGHYQLVHAGEEEALVLRVASEAQREGDALRQVDYAPERLERYELGECAPNDEAQSVDAQYACLAIAGRAFWRQSSAPGEAEALAAPAPTTAP